MSLKGLHVDEYGIIITLTLNDIDTDAAADISGYTSVNVDLKPPSGDIKTKSASFVTDGTDGQIDFTLEAGDLDEVGRWHLQVNLLSASAEISSEIVSFSVASEL